MVYSTCTLNTIENEGVIQELIKEYEEYIEIVPLSSEKVNFEN
jgi:16S rRNA C967 or C1407 C5-methylase (RsmB/RsmF family)